MGRKKEVANLSPQQADILDHMKNIGPITSLVAIRKYGVTRLSDVIYALRHKHGILILSNQKTVKTRHNQSTHVLEYFLAE